MKRIILCISLIIFALTISYGQENKDSQIDVKEIWKLADKLKNAKDDEDEILTEILELYKQFEDMLIDELNTKDNGSEEVKDKIKKKIESYQKTYCNEIIGFMDKLSLPDIKDKKFIIYNTGQWNREYDYEDNTYGEIYFFYAIGWLISETKDEINIYTPNLENTIFKLDVTLPPDWDNSKNNHPKSLPLPGSYIEHDFQKYCEAYTDNLSNDYFGDIHQAAEGVFSNITQACVIAYWASKRKLIDKSYKLIRLATKEREAMYCFKDTTVRNIVANNLAVNIRCKAITDANEGAPRPDLLKQWELLTKIPDHSFSAEAKNMIKLYKQMIQEDKNWKEPTNDEFEKMTPAEKAKYWMYKVRDCHAQQWSNPGSCYVLDDFWGSDPKEKNPAKELKNLDIEAVPILIEHMDDPRPTRCYGFHRSFSPSSYYHLFYGDVCEQVFEAISGTSIYRRQTTSGSMMRDGKASEAKKQAQAWWEEYQEKGQKQILIEAIKIGDNSSVFNARKYLKLFPDDALEVIKVGFNNASNLMTKMALMEIISKIEGEPTIKFLQNEAENNKELYIRAFAAGQLHELGKKEGLEILIKEMNDLKSVEDNWGTAVLWYNLCLTEDPIAIKTIKDNFNKLDYGFRQCVMNHIDDELETKLKSKDEAKVKKLVDEFESLLIHALDYETLGTTSSGGYSHGKSYHSPRNCDWAAHILQYWFNDKYTFDISASITERDKQIALMKIAWNKDHNLQTLPVPKKKEIKKLSDEIIKEMIDSLKNVNDDKEIDEAISEIEKKGLPALKPMKQYYESLENDNPIKSKVLSLVKRLSFIINEVKYAKDSLKPEGELLEKINKLVGNQLDGNQLINIVKYYLKNQPDNAQGIIINACRDDDFMGVTVIINITKSTFKLKKYWEISKDLKQDGKRLNVGGGNFCGFDIAVSEIPYEGIEKGIKEVFDAQLTSTIEFNLSCIQQLAD